MLSNALKVLVCGVGQPQQLVTIFIPWILHFTTEDLHTINIQVDTCFRRDHTGYMVCYVGCDVCHMQSSLLLRVPVPP